MTDRNDPSWFQWLWSEPGQAALAGAAGGIVRWITLHESHREGLFSLVVGALCAIYLGPLTDPLLDPIVAKLAPRGESAGFASFIMGLGGISIAGFLIDLIRARRSKAPSASEDRSQ